MSIRSRCINCHQQRSCIKVQARAPLPHGPVLVWNERFNMHEPVEYEADGPMVEICRSCLKEQGGVLGKFLAEGL